MAYSPQSTPPKRLYVARLHFSPPLIASVCLGSGGTEASASNQFELQERFPCLSQSSRPNLDLAVLRECLAVERAFDSTAHVCGNLSWRSLVFDEVRPDANQERVERKDIDRSRNSSPHCEPWWNGENNGSSIRLNRSISRSQSHDSLPGDAGAVETDDLSPHGSCDCGLPSHYKRRAPCVRLKFAAFNPHDGCGDFTGHCISNIEKRRLSLVPVVSSSLGPLTKIRTPASLPVAAPGIWSPSSESEARDLSTHGSMPPHLQQLLGSGMYQVQACCEECMSNSAEDA